MAPPTPYRWRAHHLLKQVSQEMHLSINHADFGAIPTFHGQNNLTVNRLYWAVDSCGFIQWGDPAQSLQLIAGTITFMPPSIDLTFDFNGGRMVAIHFNVEIFPGFDVFSGETECQQRHDHHGCKHVYDHMYAADTLGTALSLQADVLRTASSFCQRDLEELGRQLALRKKYADLINLVEERLDARLGVGDVAEYLGQTRDQLSKSFNRDMGLPLKHFLSQRLIRRTADALLAGLTVKEVASRFHFSSEFYFSRFFSKHTGQSPSHFKTNYSPKNQ